MNRGMKEAIKKRSILLFHILKFLYRFPERVVSLFLELKFIFLNKFFKNYGITKQKRKPPLIISLTSFPARINKVYLVIETLLRQTLKPDYIYLWLSKKEFPTEKEGLPKRLLEQEKRGLKIKFCERNLKSYNKLIFTLKGNPKSKIITCDDDIFYSKDLCKNLYETHLKFPKEIIGNRVSKIKFNEGKIAPYILWGIAKQGEGGMNLFPLGVGGILYPPGLLHKEIFNEIIFMNISPHNDDVWFKAMSLLNDTSCRVTLKKYKIYDILGTQKIALVKWNVGKNENDKQIKMVFDKYKLDKKIK